MKYLLVAAALLALTAAPALAQRALEIRPPPL